MTHRLQVQCTSFLIRSLDQHTFFRRRYR